MLSAFLGMNWVISKIFYMSTFWGVQGSYRRTHKEEMDGGSPLPYVEYMVGEKYEKF